MKSRDDLKKIALNTIRDESGAISRLTESVNDDFLNCIELILASPGRVVVTGIGKSAIIGQKIVATLNSTGTPAIFLHAADAIHGDIGMVTENDIVICLSKSGETPEIKILVPLLRERGNRLIAMVGNRDSYLAVQADLVIDTTVSREACPNNLAPTSSTTAQLVMGDALAICLLENRGFTPGDFARLHPGGTLGKQLYLRVADLYIRNESPVVQASDPVSRVILEISSKRLGATAVLDAGKLVGIVTDGDLRRMLEHNTDFRHLSASDIMSRNPRTILPDTMVVNALSLMRNNNITQLLVTKGETYLGVLHLHDILKEGII